MEVSLLTLNFFVSDNPFTAIHLLKTTNIKLLFPVPWWRYVMFRKVYRACPKYVTSWWIAINGNDIGRNQAFFLAPAEKRAP